MIGAMSIVSCAPFQHKMAEINSRYQLEEYRENLANGFFETVILKGRQVIEKDEETPPADAALYALGEAYAHYGFEGRDYALSQYYFEKLIENFPDSQLVLEAKLYISLLETIAAREKTVVIEIAKTKKNSPDAVHVTVPAIVPRKVVENLDFEEAAYYYRVFDLGMMIIGTCGDRETINFEKASYMLKGYLQEIGLLEIELNALQAFTVYAATAMTFWRHINFNYTKPDPSMSNHYLGLKVIADYVEEQDADVFLELLKLQGN